MKSTFLNHDTPLLTVMLQCETPETAIGRIRNANCLGADAYGLQVESLNPEHHNPDTYKRIFAEGKGRPFYVTNYRTANNRGKTDEELANGLLELAESGATLIDVMGDMFCKHSEELTDDETAINRQIKLIEKIHSVGAEVLMSSHLYKFAPAERVLEIALEQKRRGADIIKIVTGADTMEQQIENLRITDLLKKELGA
ncbi:MAG: type I 3-dehydroquinate dehydratase, partial [Clostridia bacterium]|nr:type I 3-dehydroquinate dehydratase [Clostridia bacterium]